MTLSFLAEIAWRGMLHQRSAEEALDQHLATAGRVGYCGFDPTADSLTIGNLVPIQLLVHFQRAGHVPIVLMGGGTGLIGDPSGRDDERPLLTREQVEHNVARQRIVLERLLDFSPSRPNAARIVNNLDWLSDVGLLSFLRDVGKHFSVNAMLSKDSVRERLLRRQQGISYTEFSYMLLQAYDFDYLRSAHGCSIQMAGSDQYGNITAGIDLIHRRVGGATPAFGVTAPLVTRSDGRKMGKSAAHAVWLSADRTSPYAFHQYWLNVPDADASRFLRYFTILGRDAVEELDRAQVYAPHERVAQRSLAAHLTDRVHGESERRRVEIASEALFGRGDVRSLDAATLDEIAAELPATDHSLALLEGDGLALTELVSSTALASSKREARDLVAAGAIAVNGQRCPAGRRIRRNDLVGNGRIFLRRGKRQWHATSWTLGAPDLGGDEVS
jgi:tyrosyl-tRNA synthetase